MEFRLLGPVQVAVSGQAVEVGPPQRRAVLAALAVDAGRPVAVETVIDRVWDDRLPERVRRALHAHVTRLRRLLESTGSGEDRPVQLVRRAGGYLLDVDPDQVDLHRFHRLLDRAREPGRTDTDRVLLLREAVGLWHGEPLAGLSGTWISRTRQSWCQQRVEALRAWACAELTVANPTAVLGPLTDLVGEHPLHEPLVAVLMRALYAAGRTIDALELYTLTRRRLVEDLGTEPGHELRAVQQAILRGDLGEHHLPPPSGSPSSNASNAVANRPTPPTRPAQLPADVRGFTGRRAEIDRLDAILPAVEEQATEVVISALAGTAGVGKTALAVHWAHRVRDRFPDGQLYVNLRGFDPGGHIMEPTDAVRRFLEALGLQPNHVPADLDARAALYRSRIAGRRMLVVLDNARNSAQVRPLLPGTPGCLVLVTSRNQLTGLVASDGAYPVALDLLSRQEARELLAARLGAGRVAAEPDAVAEITTHCAGLPLALTIVAARAATRPGAALRTLAGELRDNHDRLAALSTDDPATDVRAVFSWSYQSLTPDAARLFRLLGLRPGPDTSIPAAASLAGVSAERVRPLLAELALAHLVVEHTVGRYTSHDLLRAYAADLAHHTDLDEQRHAATRRMLDHYLHTAHTADRLLNPVREPITIGPPEAGTTPQNPADHGQALAWFSAEHAVLLAAVNHAAGSGLDVHTWQLAWSLTNYLHRQGHWHDLLATQHAAVAALQRLADPRGQAHAHRYLAITCLRIDQLDEARTHLEHAFSLYRQAGDHVGLAHSHNHLSEVLAQQGQLTEALEHSGKALDLYRAADNRWGQGLALNAIGWLHALLGEYQTALTHCRQALPLLQDVGDRDGQAETWDSLGYAHHHLGDYRQATTCYQHALDLQRDLGARYEQASTLTNLADNHHAAGNPDDARVAWRQALSILDELEHPDAEQIRTRLAHTNT